jgi:hypothetical protein
MGGTPSDGAGLVLGGEVVLTGPFGNTAGDVFGVSFGLRLHDCVDGVCPITLTSLDLAIEDMELGQLIFKSITGTLVQPAMGRLVDEAVTFGAGTMVGDVEFSLRFFGKDLFGGQRFTVRVANQGVARATLGVDRLFSIDEATFPFGEQTAMLTTIPSPTFFE